MPTWNPNQYLKFAEERARPCRELAARIELSSVRRVIDVGCGPGNSTEVLANRWPDAEITGLDNSTEMIGVARKGQPARRWVIREIADWAPSAKSDEKDGKFDVVFSNAALQWLPDHAALYPTLLERVAPGGAFAAQIPADFDAPAHKIMRDIAKLPAWRDRFPARRLREWQAHDAEFYYDVLAPLASRVDIWKTEYLHVMPDAESLVEFYKGSGMRPFLDLLATDAERMQFTGEYLERIRIAYPRRPDGRVLFPMLRLFVIAYRGASSEDSAQSGAK
jgi:trans-aconitate 2-methyltransferase